MTPDKEIAGKDASLDDSKAHYIAPAIGARDIYRKRSMFPSNSSGN